MKVRQLTKPKKIAVNKGDLIKAWSLLERMVVSIRKIGSAHAIPIDQDEQTPEERRQMLEAIGDYFSPEMFQELSRARRILAEYLPRDEAERISEKMEEKGQYWRAKN